MVSEEQLKRLTPIVQEAVRYQLYRHDNHNPALGRAIDYVDRILLPWAHALAGGEFDVENAVADAGLEMLLRFPKFRGMTGREFFFCMKKIVDRGIAKMRRLWEGKGRPRRAKSLERDAGAARLAERLASDEPSPDVAAMIRENAARLHRAMRGLTVEQARVVRLHGIEGRPFQEVGAKFGHTASWAHDLWKAGATEIRTRLMRPGQSTPRRPVTLAIAGE